MNGRKWTHDELIVAFNLYCKIPFGKMHKGNPEVIRLAKLLDRTPSAITFKLVNFARLDPELKKRGIKGASNGSKTDVTVWNEFYDNWSELSYQSELVLAKLIAGNGENQNEEIAEEVNNTEKMSVVKTRLRQSFFRSVILSAYDNKCCITGISLNELLTASHIVPWAMDKKNRVNPSNGLCLNALHDRAFDKGLITITTDYRLKLSRRLTLANTNQNIQENFIKYKDQTITLPERFTPGVIFLQYHNRNIFLGD